MSFCFYEEGVIVIRDKYSFLIISSLFPVVNLLICILDENFLVNVINPNWMIREFVRLSFAAVAEELFFRGLVLRELVFSYRWQSIRVSLIVSLVFGVLHLLNVNSYATWSYAIVQSICAFAVSFNLCAIFIKTKSLLWCVIIHALINITSIGVDCGVNRQHLLLSNLESIIFLSVSFIYLVNSIKMLNSEIVEGK